MEYMRQRHILEKLKINKRTLYGLIEAGMPIVTLPTGSRLYCWKDIDAWLQKYSSANQDNLDNIMGRV